MIFWVFVYVAVLYSYTMKKIGTFYYYYIGVMHLVRTKNFPEN